MTERSGLPRTPKDLERSLIASARLDVRPAPQVVRNRILAVMTAAGALGTGSAVSGATTGLLGRLAIVKWIAVTAVVGAAGVGGYAALNRAHLSATNVGHAGGPPSAVAHSDQAPVTSPPPSEDKATSTAPPEEVTPSSPAAQHHRATPKVSRQDSHRHVFARSEVARSIARAQRSPRAIRRGRSMLDGYDVLKGPKARGHVPPDSGVLEIGRRQAARDWQRLFWPPETRRFPASQLLSP
jgi:hypothetical protein